ncbi:MAG TPA: pilus assembly protein N-terminal domain-containing protein [Myxococcota bacterium]|nr:pilus assembly protein N-terminal domain-containing protein [Myxococcota bacterium]
MNRLRTLLALLIAALAVVVLARPHDGYADDDLIDDVYVVIQDQVAVDVPYEFGNISYASDTIIRVAPLRESRQLLIAGRRAGTTSVIVYDTAGTLRDQFEVTVIPANLSRVMRNVQDLLSDIEGLKYRIVNDRVYIQGEVSIDEEMQRVEDLAQAEPLVESMVTLSPVAQRLLSDLIEQQIDRPGVEATLVNNMIILEGVVHSQAELARADAIARAFYPDAVNVLDLREVERIPGRAKTIVINVHFVELAKSLTTTWAIEWTPLAVQGPEAFFQRDYDNGAWSEAYGYATATITSFLPRIEQARTSGYARVLENPTISVKSGDSATIFAGAEYPYLVSQGLYNTVEFKDIGIRVDVTPYAQDNDVDMDIKVEVTALGEVAANGYQAVNKSELQTSEFARAGESVVVGGLQRVSDTIDYNRVPEEDVENSIYSLYRNKEYKKSKSQFLVFLTPRIHETSSSANTEIKDQFNLDEVRQ